MRQRCPAKVLIQEKTQSGLFLYNIDMTGKLARQLVDDYIGGWVDSNSTKILSTLASDCIVIESHGPTYNGSKQIKEWINEWYLTGTVDRWDINSFFITKDTAFFEWSFTCSIDGKTSSIDGASIVQFKKEKIVHIHEYRMTKPAFDYFESESKS